MTGEAAAAGDKAWEMRIVLVGVQLDSNGRELLDWALTRVAQRGDRVLAVHICRTTGPSSLSLIRALDEYLEEYEGLCSLKQVALVGRVSRGNSIKRTLVKEAKLCSAAAVVVGVNKGNPFGGTVSVARYCEKKLPPRTSLIAVHKGKVFLKREASIPPEGVPKTTLASMLYPSFRMDSTVTAADASLLVEPVMEATSSMCFDAGSLSLVTRMKEEDETVTPTPIYTRMPGDEPGSVTQLLRRLPETTPGWPLLRRTMQASPLPQRVTDRTRNMSVVQWVMNLPSRTLPPDATVDGTPSLANRSPSSPASLQEELETVLQKNSSSCRWFSRFEIQKYTDQFSLENLIGKGGSSRVYRGRLPDGQPIAVKLAKLTVDAWRDFLSEVDIITSLRHKNIVALTGINVEDNDLVSVYRFFSKGSLEQNLHCKKAKSSLTWDTRFKIALGVAEALHGLHICCPRAVIHRDVKSSNILLSDDFDPQLSDFGLALWAPISTYITHSDVVGTFGYLAPEYFMYGKVSHKIDVYSFGVVLLELVTGRKPISNDLSMGKGSLVMWATQVLEQGELTQLLDPDLDAMCDEREVQRVVFAASLCLRRSARLRPPMSEILRLLKGEEGIASWMLGSHGCKDGPEDETDPQDEEVYPPSSIASHLGLALLDVDDAASVSSVEQSFQGNLEDYLRDRWSRSSSFD